MTLTVENSKSGWDLPTTGGIGTILFTFVGLALMGAAIVAYLRRNKMVEE
ncbi:LPXTG cell wall anchor domain-containing protein [Bacillus sp. N9]